MIEYLGECHHDCHNVMDAVGHTKMLAAQYYTSILTQLTNHKNDKHVHITTEDREKWDSKADKSSIRDLEMSLINKANKNEIPRNVSELKNDVPYLTAATLESQLEALGYVTLHDIKCKLCNNFNLDDYATIDWVNSILSRYALKTDLDNYYTKAEANAKFALKGDYLTKAIADGYYQPKGDYALRSEIPTIPEIPSLAGYLKNTDFNYISSVPASGSGIYTLGRIVVGNTEYPIYGRDMDTTSGGSTGSTVSYVPNGIIPQSSGSYVIGTLNIDGTAHTIWGKDTTGGSGGGGTTPGGGGEGGYDDTELRGLIQSLQDALNAFRQQKTEEISQDVEDLIDQFNDLKDLFETGEIFHDSGWQEKLDAYLQIVGKGFYDEDGNLIGNWAQLLQTYNQIKEYVAQIREIIDPETGAIDYEAIYTKVDQKIAQNTAIATLSANHAFADGQKNLIEYLSSGIDAVAGDLTTFADFYSTYSSGIADVTSALLNKVDKSTYEASLKAVADTTMYKVQRDNNGKPVLDQNGNYIYLDENDNVTTKANRIIDTQNTAGLVLDTDLDSAIAALVATNNSGTTAAIKTLVEGDSSLISLIANQVTIPTGELVIGEDDGNQIKASVYPVYQRHQQSSTPYDNLPQIRLTHDNVKSVCIGGTDLDKTSYSDDGWDFKNVIGYDGSGKLASGNIQWASDGSGSIGGNIEWNSGGHISIGDTQIQNATVSDLVSQAVTITANDNQPISQWVNGGGTGLYLRIGGVSNDIRVMVDSNGFLKIDLS